MTKVAHCPVFHFILQPEFPVNAMILATEALRIANQNSGRELFNWFLVSADGQDVRASNDMWISIEHSLADINVSHTDSTNYVFILEGNLPTQANSPELLGKLRELYRCGATLAGIDTGSFALTQAGLAAESVVVHWEAASTYQERFSRQPISNQRYQLDGRIISCAGGVSTLDLVLELINRHYGESLSIEVANALVHHRVEGWRSQRALEQDIADSRSFSDKVIALMQRHLDFPLRAAEIASRLSVSVSTLERHCHRHFGSAPMQVYLGLRLQAARNFLFYEDYGIREVAMAYGFSSTSVFSRTFKAYFGQTPSAFRKSIRNKQTGSRLPELTRLYASRSSHDV